jgi:hypothetical protein
MHSLCNPGRKAIVAVISGAAAAGFLVKRLVTTLGYTRRLSPTDSQ